MLPANTATVLQFLFPAANPLTAWEVKHDPGKVVDGVQVRPASTTIAAWHLQAAQPSEAEIIAAGNSANFAAWLDNRADPVKRRRLSAKALLESNDPQIVLLRGILKVLFQSLAEVRTKAGLPNRTFAQAMQSVVDTIDAGNGEV